MARVVHAHPYRHKPTLAGVRLPEIGACVRESVSHPTVRRERPCRARAAQHCNVQRACRSCAADGRETPCLCESRHGHAKNLLPSAPATLPLSLSRSPRECVSGMYAHGSVPHDSPICPRVCVSLSPHLSLSLAVPSRARTAAQTAAMTAWRPRTTPLAKRSVRGH